MRAIFISTALLFGLWLLLSGHYTPLLIGLGFISALGASLISKRMGGLDDEGLPMGILVRLPRVSLWIIWQILKADWEVIRMILAPDRVSGRFITIRGNQKTIAALVTYGNFITLTPGTLTVDVDETAGTFLIHALNADFANPQSFVALDQCVQKLEAGR